MEMFRNMFSLSGKVALVGGGAGGIGATAAESFAALGATVLLTSQSQDKADKVAGMIRDNGGEAAGFQLNVSRMSDIENLVARLYSEFGQIDVLLNCIGSHREAKAEEYTEEDWDYIFNVNLKSAFFLSKAVASRQIEQGAGGKHIHVSSVRSGLGIGRGFVSYCSSKGGMNMMIKQLASEWGKHGITVNGIAPTFTRTALVAKYLDDPDFYNPLVARIPLGRVAETEDVAGLAMYMASPASDFLTGQIVFLDGGVTAIQ